MSTYYLDTSALVKRYFPEAGSAWITALCDPIHNHWVLISMLTRVEAAAAFALKQRTGVMTLGERDAAVKLLVLHATTEYQLIPVHAPLLDRAMSLTQRYGLRGYDAVQLATALLAHEQHVAASLAPLTFVAADAQLLAAAQAEGLLVENPQDHR